MRKAKTRPRTWNAPRRRCGGMNTRSHPTNTAKLLKSPTARTSPNSSIYRFYPETVIARHVIGLNHVAIGIENIGDGDLGDTSADHPLTEKQLQTNVALVKHLKGRHPDPEFLIGHQEYREVEQPSHPAHHLFWEEIPDYRTEKSDPGVHIMRRLRRSLRRAAS